MPSPDMCEFEAWGETPAQLRIAALNVAADYFQCTPEEVGIHDPVIARPKYQNPSTGKVYMWEAEVTAERIPPL
jgi:hypothetical protein